MKKHILTFCLFFAFATSVFGQTAIDKLVSMDIPGEVIKLDTIIKGIRVLQYYSTNDTEAFILQRMEIDSKENDLNNLPSDVESLRKTYQKMIDGQITGMEKGGYEFRDSIEYKVDKYIAYKILYNDAETGIQNGENRIIILNEYAYISNYINWVDINSKNKDAFFNSLKIEQSEKPRQMIGNSSAFKAGYIAGTIVIYGMLLIGFIFVIRAFKKKKKV